MELGDSFKGWKAHKLDTNPAFQPCYILDRVTATRTWGWQISHCTWRIQRYAFGSLGGSLRNSCVPSHGHHSCPIGEDQAVLDKHHRGRECVWLSPGIHTQTSSLCSILFLTLTSQPMSWRVMRWWALTEPSGFKPGGMQHLRYCAIHDCSSPWSTVVHTGRGRG